MPDNLTVTPAGDREIVMTREFDAPRRLVFEAYTKPALIRRWLSGPPGWSLVVCDVALSVGGAYRYVWRGPDGVQMGMSGVYREIVVPERIVGSEIFDEDWTGGETLSTIALVEHEGRTTLTMTVVYSSRDARDAALKTGMAEGVGFGYDKLAELLAATPAEAGGGVDSGG